MARSKQQAKSIGGKNKMKPNESKNKLPEGVPVMIDDGYEVYSLTLIDLRYEKPNGTAYTFEQLADREKAIARAAYSKGRSMAYAEIETGGALMSADDYLQSEEFKKLVGEM